MQRAYSLISLFLVVGLCGCGDGGAALEIKAGGAPAASGTVANAATDCTGPSALLTGCQPGASATANPANTAAGAATPPAQSASAADVAKQWVGYSSILNFKTTVNNHTTTTTLAGFVDLDASGRAFSIYQFKQAGSDWQYDSAMEFLQDTAGRSGDWNIFKDCAKTQPVQRVHVVYNASGQATQVEMFEGNSVTPTVMPVSAQTPLPHQPAPFQMQIHNGGYTLTVNDTNTIDCQTVASQSDKNVLHCTGTYTVKSSQVSMDGTLTLIARQSALGQQVEKNICAIPIDNLLK